MSSNFFDKESVGDAGADEDVILIARALIGVAIECASLGTEIAEVGAAVAGRDRASSVATRTVELETFEILAESAQVQGRLIAYFSHHLLTGTPCHGNDVLDLIDADPDAGRPPASPSRHRRRPSRRRAGRRGAAPLAGGSRSRRRQGSLGFEFEVRGHDARAGAKRIHHRDTKVTEEEKGSLLRAGIPFSSSRPLCLCGANDS